VPRERGGARDTSLCRSASKVRFLARGRQAISPRLPPERNNLRQQGLTPDTWDREKAGIEIKRERVG
jgi:hypothetical protein